MEKTVFIKNLLKAALDAGIEAAEVYTSYRDSFNAMCNNGEVTSYQVATKEGLSLRGLYNGKMGYASTEAYDDEAVAMLVNGVIEAASLIEDEDVQEIYAGDKEYVKIDNYNPELDKVGEDEKIKFMLEVEQKVKNCGDERIVQVGRTVVSTSSNASQIQNTYGLDLSDRDNLAFSYVMAVAKEGERVSTGMGMDFGRDFSKLSSDKIAKDAVEEALFYLHASPVPSGNYRVIIDNHCMPDLMGAFGSVFSAEAAQKGMSLLAGQEGQMVAAECVTLMDDPHMAGGLASGGFDAEGVATYTKAVIENGKLNTLLHNLKTAHKQGVSSTGNASRGYNSTVGIAPANFYFQPSEISAEEMLARLGDGLVITEVAGLHAGANAVSGDFSLSAKGYMVRGGAKAEAVKQITVAGNFFTLLTDIEAVGSDLKFGLPSSSQFGSPSLLIRTLAIAGK